MRKQTLILLKVEKARNGLTLMIKCHRISTWWIVVHAINHRFVKYNPDCLQTEIASRQWHDAGFTFHIYALDIPMHTIYMYIYTDIGMQHMISLFMFEP